MRLEERRWIKQKRPIIIRLTHSTNKNPHKKLAGKYSQAIEHICDFVKTQTTDERRTNNLFATFVVCIANKSKHSFTSSTFPLSHQSTSIGYQCFIDWNTSNHWSYFIDDILTIFLLFSCHFFFSPFVLSINATDSTIAINHIRSVDRQQQLCVCVCVFDLSYIPIHLHQ